MRWRNKILPGTAIAAIAVIALFDVDINPRFSLPRDEEIPDPAVERAYEDCRDEIRQRAMQEAHAETDNPEVHSTMQRLAEADAAAQCRVQHPLTTIRVHRPLDVNLVDFRYRY